MPFRLCPLPTRAVRSLPFLLPCTIALIALPLHADAATLIKPPNNLGLVGYWSFNEGSSTRATDFSGNGNTGTTTSPGIPTWTSGKRGAALDFDGTDDYVGVASSTSLSPTSAVTIAAWVYARDWNDTGTIVCKKNVSDLLPDYCLTTTQSGGAHLRVMVTGTDGLFLSDFTNIAAPSTSAWHHIVATFDSSATSLYVDGVYQGGETPNAGAIRTNGGVLNIGSTDFALNGALDGFNGKIDEVRVYNRALSASAVAQLYQSGAVKINASSAELDNGSNLEGGLTGHWTFDGKNLTEKVYDSSPNGRSGYFNNTATSSALAVGVLGQSIVLDGTDDYVSTGSAISNFITASDGTMALWMKPTGANPAIDSRPYYGRGAIGDTGGFAGIYRSQVSSGVNNIYAFNWDSNSDSVGASYSLNKWTHIVWVHTGGTLYLYKDGALIGSTASGNTGAMTGAFTIGRAYTVPPTPNWNGGIDDVRTYNRGLSAAEVQHLYNLGAAKINASSADLDNGSTLEGGLVGHWTFDGKDLTDKVYDRSGNGNNGYFINIGGSTSTSKVIGKLGQAVTFSGVAASNNYIDIPNSASVADNLTNMTVSAWFKTTNNTNMEILVCVGVQF